MIMDEIIYLLWFFLGLALMGSIWLGYESQRKREVEWKKQDDERKAIMERIATALEKKS